MTGTVCIISQTLYFFLSFEFLHSPSGKLVQIEYALNAVAAGAPSVGIKVSNGVVIATEKKHKSVLYDEHSVRKIEKLTKNIGMVYSGMGPDYRSSFYLPSTSNSLLQQINSFLFTLGIIY